MSHRSATAFPHNTQICATVSVRAREQENYEFGDQRFESFRARRRQSGCRGQAPPQCNSTLGNCSLHKTGSARWASMDARSSDPAQNRRRRSRLLHDMGSARNDHRTTGENQRTSLGDRRQFRNDEERTRPRSQRNALLAWLASSRLAGHARLRHDGGDPRSRQQSRAAPKSNARQSQDARSTWALTNSSLIRWSMQEIRRIATRLARKRIRPEFVIAWSPWRRAHQAHAKRAHMKSQL